MKEASEISVDEAVQQQFEQLVNDYEKAMDDDFNVQNAMTSLYEFAKLMNVYAEKEQVSKDLAKAMLAKFEALTQIIGIKMPKQELLDEEIEKLIQERTEARANKDYARSDEIRDELKCQGIILEDTAQGTRWRRE